jgi:hypothetical protein
MTDDDFELFEIDLNRLEEEWVKQPDFFWRWSKKLTDARYDLAQAEATLSVVDAGLDSDIRSNPEAYALEKVTEGAIKSVITLNQKHCDAVRSIDRLQHRVNLLSSYVQAIDHRKRALENAVDLHGQGYFCKPYQKSDKPTEIKSTAAMKRVNERTKKRGES